jgi:hypothetical protein
MIRKSFSLGAVVAVLSLIVASLSCGFNQHLVGITVSPQGSTVILSGLGQQVGTQFTAIGTYVHPPETRDLTSTAVWATDTPLVIALDPTTPGLFNTTGTGCGTNLGVTASVYSDPSNHSAGSVVVGSATISVAFSTGSGVTCP